MTQEEQKVRELLKREFYSKLPHDKIKINWNKRPIAMSLFLSFLKVSVVRSKDHLGYDMGWTLLENKELGLRIGGGKVDGVELLDSVQYGIKLDNPYNNYVNPFYLFDILTSEGQQFFLNYYADEIGTIVAGIQSNIKILESQLLFKREILAKVSSEIRALKNNSGLAIEKQPTTLNQGV